MAEVAGSIFRRILVACTIVSVLAGCSGGGGSTVPRPSGASQSVSITLDRSQLASAAAKRNAKFVGSDADDLNYAFSPAFNGSTGDVSLTNCPNNVCTITLGSVPVGTYTLTVTLKHGGASGTVVGTGVSNQFTVALNATNAVSIAIAPVLSGVSAGPAISIPANSVLYADGVTTGQTIVATVTENDPEGVAVCGSSVPNWPTISVSGTSVTGLTGLPATISSAPPCSSNGSTVTIAYNGSSNPGATSVALQASDGQQGNAPASVSIPIVALAVSSTDSGFTQSSSSLNVSGSTSNSHTITITETNGFYTGETGFTSSSSCNGIVDITSDTFNAGSAASPNSTQTFRLVGHLKSSAGCTLTIASTKHPALSTKVSVNLNSAYTLFDDATLVVSGGTTAVQASWLSSTTDPDGGVAFSVPAGLTVANLNTLSTDYLFTAGTCAGGAPRFAIEDGGKYVFAYLGPQFPVTSGVCAGSTYSNSGNLISAAGSVDATQFNLGYPTWSAFQAAHGSDVVTGIFLVVDGFTPEGPITAQFKNTNINGQIFGY